MKIENHNPTSNNNAPRGTIIGWYMHRNNDTLTFWVEEQQKDKSHFYTSFIADFGKQTLTAQRKEYNSVEPNTVQLTRESYQNQIVLLKNGIFHVEPHFMPLYQLPEIEASITPEDTLLLAIETAQCPACKTYQQLIEDLIELNIYDEDNNFESAKVISMYDYPAVASNKPDWLEKEAKVFPSVFLFDKGKRYQLWSNYPIDNLLWYTNYPTPQDLHAILSAQKPFDEERYLTEKEKLATKKSDKTPTLKVIRPQ